MRSIDQIKQDIRTHEDYVASYSRELRAAQEEHFGIRNGAVVLATIGYGERRREVEAQVCELHFRYGRPDFKVRPKTKAGAWSQQPQYCSEWRNL